MRKVVGLRQRETAFELVLWDRGWSSWHVGSPLSSFACTVEIHAGLQLLAVTPAQPKSGSITEQHVVFTIRVKLETANSIELNDGRTVNPAKGLLIQLFIEFRHAAAQEV
jgi:hypothetical protein